MTAWQRLSAVILAGALTACTAPYPVDPLTSDALQDLADPQIDRQGTGADRLFILTLSGGGTRASALAQGALAALESTRLPAERSMLDEVDMVSSTSGGSVTAANFVARGASSFADFEDRFLR